jgi:hypothetical protein
MWEGNAILTHTNCFCGINYPGTGPSSQKLKEHRMSREVPSL